jgi:hypothetical protein
MDNVLALQEMATYDDTEFPDLFPTSITTSESSLSLFC